jgi:tRNA-splicing ligase RtcB (3'-phosphate/5'-hydroxy nucleic acid ligase)
MTTANFNYMPVEGGSPLKLWNKGVTFEDKALEQMRNVAKLPFIYHHVAGMPDCHWGQGATVGSVIATKGAIVPAAVGVDLGCGMCAWQLSIGASELPDSLGPMRADIERAVPHGRTNNGGEGDRGAWGDAPDEVADRWVGLWDRYRKIVAKHPKAQSFNNVNHLGTLGTGNHFIEVCLDENDRVWVMLHSGSRGAGNKIGSYFIERAKEEMRRWHIDRFLPDQDLAYLVEHTELLDDYVEAVGWAQEFAWQNRLAMMRATLIAMEKHLPPFHVTEEAVNCHHNYLAKENHFGSNVWITRKGAVRARAGDLGIIPGSMGTGSFIVRGKGCAESFHSCSHGAGRAMSRGAAKKLITLEDHAKATEGIECRKDLDVIDESPAAYKDVNAVIAAQSDLIEVVHRLRQVLNVKG